MKHDIKAPSVGESITEVRIGKWKKQAGELVKSGDILLEIESDKATVEVAADAGGVLQSPRAVGDTVKVGEVIGAIDDAASPSMSVVAASTSVPTPTPADVLAPSVRKMVADQGVDVSQIAGTGKGGRVTKADVIRHSETRATGAVAGQPVSAPQRPTAVASGGRERRVPMSMLRQKIAERLVQAQHTAAILTTFNECDMSAILEIRAKHKEGFKVRHGVPLSIMSFFTRAVVEALKAIPAVNGRIDGKDIVYHEYYDVGIAVGTDRGLVVPVLRDIGGLGFVDLEKQLAAMATRARDGKLSIQELTGGTFTISNGGVYGSLLSTPILNPPQSAILGMHKTQERPVVVNGQIVVRPMMFLALSYDHRIIDGKEAVTFLIKVKEGIENPRLVGWDDNG